MTSVRHWLHYCCAAEMEDGELAEILYYRDYLGKCHAPTKRLNINDMECAMLLLPTGEWVTVALDESKVE